MTLFPNLYSRVVHYTDLIPHIPPKDMGFAHSGNEVYYSQSGTSMVYRVCLNKAGSSEDNSCSNANYLNTSIDSHRTYLGGLISNMCTKHGALKGAEFFESLKAA